MGDTAEDTNDDERRNGGTVDALYPRRGACSECGTPTVARPSRTSALYERETGIDRTGACACPLLSARPLSSSSDLLPGPPSPLLFSSPLCAAGAALCFRVSATGREHDADHDRDHDHDQRTGLTATPATMLTDGYAFRQ